MVFRFHWNDNQPARRPVTTMLLRDSPLITGTGLGEFKLPGAEVKRFQITGAEAGHYHVGRDAHHYH